MLLEKEKNLSKYQLIKPLKTIIIYIRYYLYALLYTKLSYAKISFYNRYKYQNRSHFGVSVV